MLISPVKWKHRRRPLSEEMRVASKGQSLRGDLFLEDGGKRMSAHQLSARFCLQADHRPNEQTKGDTWSL